MKVFDNVLVSFLDVNIIIKCYRIVYINLTGEQIVVNIDGMTCDACVQTIQTNVAKVPGIISIVVSYLNFSLKIFVVLI